VELPVLPGRALRGAEPGDRQHHPAQARAAVPRVGRAIARSTPTRASRRRLRRRPLTNEQAATVIADRRCRASR
jgi:hypothetical protein